MYPINIMWSYDVLPYLCPQCLATSIVWGECERAGALVRVCNNLSLFNHRFMAIHSTISLDSLFAIVTEACTYVVCWRVSGPGLLDDEATVTYNV